MRKIYLLLLISFLFSSCSTTIEDPNPGSKHYILISKIEIAPDNENVDKDKCKYYYTGWSHSSPFEKFNGSFYDCIGKYNIRDTMGIYSYNEIMKYEDSIKILNAELKRMKIVIDTLSKWQIKKEFKKIEKVQSDTLKK